MTEQKITLDIKEERIWKCSNCDVQLVLINSKRKFKTNQGIKPYTKSWDRYLSLTRNCKHEQKIYGKNYCRICGMKLTNQKSVEREIGPVCWHNSQLARQDLLRKLGSMKRIE